MEEQTILAKIMSIIAPDMEDEDESAESEEDDLKCKEFLDMSFAPFVETATMELSARLPSLWLNIMACINRGFQVEQQQGVASEAIKESFDATSKAMIQFSKEACIFEVNMYLMRKEPQIAPIYGSYVDACKSKFCESQRQVCTAEHIVRELCPEKVDLAPTVSGIVAKIYSLFVGPSVSFGNVLYYSSLDRTSLVDALVRDLCSPGAVMEAYAVKNCHILAAVQLQRKYEPHICVDMI